MELSQIQMLVCIAEGGSITAAAKQLFITPVSLMQQLNRFEFELGYPVCVRTHRGCKLTQAGSHLYIEGKKLLAQVDQLKNECKALAESKQHTVRMSIYKPYALMQLSEMYHQQHPETLFQYEFWESYDPQRIGVQMNHLNLDLLQHGYINGLETQGLCFEPLWQDRYCCFFQNRLPISKLDCITAEDLLNYRVLSFSEPSEVVDQIEQHLATKGITLIRTPYSEATVLKECSNDAVFILEELVTRIFPHLCHPPLKPDFPCVHGLVYRQDISGDALKFLNYVKQTKGHHL